MSADQSRGKKHDPSPGRNQLPNGAHVDPKPGGIRPAELALLDVYRIALEEIRDFRDEQGNLITGRQAEAIAHAALDGGNGR